jgi:hypothetical protein
MCREGRIRATGWLRGLEAERCVMPLLSRHNAELTSPTSNAIAKHLLGESRGRLISLPSVKLVDEGHRYYCPFPRRGARKSIPRLRRSEADLVIVPATLSIIVVDMQQLDAVGAQLSAQYSGIISFILPEVDHIVTASTSLIE